MGKILLEEKNLLTEEIPREDRDKTVNDFVKMHKAAKQVRDEFYALESLYGELDAPIFRYFKSWRDFIQQEYGKNVSFNSWQALQDIFLQNPNFQSISSLNVFLVLDPPLAHAGFRHPGSDQGLLVDIPTWRKWKENWFSSHQELIDWTGREGNFFVNDDVIEEILTQENNLFVSNELQKAGVEDISKTKIDEFINSKSICHADEDLNKTLKENASAIFFHSYVMNSHPRGGDRQGYTNKIGAIICKANYYVELTDLAKLEKEASPAGRMNTQRTIYGIKSVDNKWKFISFDFEKGMFEFYDDDGTHLGEYRFDGSQNASNQTDHNLRCVENWKRKKGI